MLCVDNLVNIYCFYAIVTLVASHNDGLLFNQHNMPDGATIT